jgi:O-antigen ligase
MVAKKTQLQSQPRFLFLFLSLFIIAVLLIAPYNEGLFNGNLLQFEKPIFITILFGSIAFLLLTISMFFSKSNLLEYSLPSLLVWLVPLSLFISSWTAASHTLAVNGVYIYLFFAAMFVLARHMAGEKYGMAVIAYSQMGSGYLIVLFGFMNWFGDASIFGLVNWAEVPGQVSNVYRDAVQIDSNGPRMASVFQYANTYAGYLTGLLFASLYIMVTSKLKPVVITSSLMLVPILLALLLSLSRGGWAAALVSCLVILIFIHLHKQLLMMVYGLIGVIVTFIIYGYMNDSGTSLREQFSAVGYAKAWFILIIASLSIVLLVLLINKYVYPYIHRKLHQFSIRKWSSLILPISLLILGSVMGYLLLQDTPLNRALPDNIEVRVDNINFNQHSVLERGTFYSDAWKLFKDYPVIGAGSGAWYTLYEEYQNNPYTSRQAHNFIMQHLTATGLFGILILIGFLGLVYYLFIRKHYATRTETLQEEYPTLFFIIATSLFIHSLVDFDMSFVYIGLIFFLCLGAMTTNTLPLINLSSFRWRKLLPLFLAAISIIMLIGSSQLLKANSLYKDALSKTNNAKAIQDFMGPLDEAMRIRSNQPNFILAKSDILSQLYENSKDESYYTQNLNLIHDAITHSPYSREFVQRLTGLLLLKDDLKSAYKTINESYIKNPWFVPLYESKMTLAIELADSHIKQGLHQEAQIYIDDVISTYEKFNKQILHLSTLPEGQGQGNPFAITPPIQLAVAKANYYKEDYVASTALLKPLLSELLDQPNNREIARWYLAGLRKQGEDDTGLYTRLTTSDSTEIAHLEQLLQVDLPR